MLLVSLYGSFLSLEKFIEFVQIKLWAAQVARQFSTAFSPGRDPGARDRVSRKVPCMEPASPSACLSLSVVNKKIKK